MCELFGFSSSREEEMNDYLKTFFSHCNEHPHGWGLSILDENKYQIVKEPVKARKSVILGNILLNPIICKNMLAHIRLATIGKLEFYNCHPFVKKDDLGRRWTLIHNGTIFDSSDLCKYNLVEEGDTDSERILLYIVDKINALERINETPLSLKERFDIVSLLIKDLSHANKLNLIISDGEQMYVHANLKDSLYYLKNDSSIFISTQALDDGAWKEVPINKTFSLVNGSVLFESGSHSNEYIVTEEQIKFIERFLETLEVDLDEEYVW